MPGTGTVLGYYLPTEARLCPTRSRGGYDRTLRRNQGGIRHVARSAAGRQLEGSRNGLGNAGVVRQHAGSGKFVKFGQIKSFPSPLSRHK